MRSSGDGPLGQILRCSSLIDPLDAMLVHRHVLTSLGITERRSDFTDIRIRQRATRNSTQHLQLLPHSELLGHFRRLPPASEIRLGRRLIYRKLCVCDAARMNTGVNRQTKADTARDKLIPRKLVRQSRRDTKEEDVICHHSAHCRQILSIKTPLSSPSKLPNHLTCGSCSLCLWKAHGFVFVCVTSDRTISKMAT